MDLLCVLGFAFDAQATEVTESDGITAGRLLAILTSMEEALGGIGQVLALLQPAAFQACFVHWLHALRAQAAAALPLAWDISAPST